MTENKDISSENIVSVKTKFPILLIHGMGFRDQ